jgi:hypothetical protein
MLPVLEKGAPAPAATPLDGKPESIAEVVAPALVSGYRDVPNALWLRVICEVILVVFSWGSVWCRIPGGFCLPQASSRAPKTSPRNQCELPPIRWFVFPTKEGGQASIVCRWQRARWWLPTSLLKITHGHRSALLLRRLLGDYTIV